MAITLATIGAIVGASRLIGDDNGTRNRYTVDRSEHRIAAVRATPLPGGTVLLQEEKVVVTPTPTPLPEPIIEPTSISPAPPAAATGIRAIICSYSWPCEVARAVACSESGFDHLASNPSGARGVFQLMPVHAWRFEARGWNYWTDWSDPVKNTAIAYEIWTKQGWTPWMSSYPWSCN